MSFFPSVQIRRIFTVVNGGTPTPHPENWGGNVLWATPADLAGVNGGILGLTSRTLTQQGLLSGSAAVPGGSLLVSTRAPIGYVVETIANTAFNQGCRGLVPRLPLDIRFFRYQLIALNEELQRRGQGTTFLELSTDGLAGMKVLYPALPVQASIADYLDTETARIDALLSTKQRMIELFRARTDALVEDEIGKLRQQYSEVPLKRLVWEVDQRLGERTPPEMLSVSIHHGVVPRSLMTDKLPRAEELTAYKMCEPDDIVLNRMRAFQGGVGRSPQAGIVSPDYAVLRPCSLALSQYLHYVFRSPWFIGEMTARLRGIGDSEQGNVRTPRINVAELGLIKIPLPSVTIQAQLVDKIDGKVAQMRTIVEKLSHQIDLLRDHRQALITAAVTGELEIPMQEAVA